MFEQFEFGELELMYRGLKALIETGRGVGFHNADQGHPVYALGSKGEQTDEWRYADSPERNELYKLLSGLSSQLKSRGIGGMGYTWWDDFGEWKDFCKFAFDHRRSA